MKYLLGTIYILIGLILWLIIMIPSFIIRTTWEFNFNAYNFSYQWDNYVRRIAPLSVYSIYSSDYYTYKSYFHYLFNIKNENKYLKW